MNPHWTFHTGFLVTTLMTITLLVLRHKRRTKWLTYGITAMILTVSCLFVCAGHIPTSIIDQYFTEQSWMLNIAAPEKWRNSLFYAYLLPFFVIMCFAKRCTRLSNLNYEQSAILLMGIFMPWPGNIISTLWLNPFAYQGVAFFAFIIIGLAFSWDIFKTRPTDIISSANKALVQNTTDAVIVTDEQNRFLYINPAAQKFIEQPVEKLMDQSVECVFLSSPQLLDCLQEKQKIKKIISFGQGTKKQFLNVCVLPLHDLNDCFIGRLITWQDITKYEQTKKMLQQNARELELQIAEDAIELGTLNQQLQDEINELKHTETTLRERITVLTQTNADLVSQIDTYQVTEKELLQHNRELLSLQSAAAATASSLDLSFVLDTVTWEMVNLLRVEDCTIWAWDQEIDVISVIADYGSALNWEGKAETRSCNLVDYPLKKRVLFERFAQYMTISQDDVDSAEYVYMKQLELKTMLILPMIFQDRVVGLVEIKDGQVERTFTGHQISLIQLLANQAASAVENARLYKRAQQEISERLRVEDQIKASLKEKVVLLQEIHHRVKNNLQVISSLLNLQSQSIKDQATLEMFKESQNRIRSMALIHERLYRSDDLTNIDFAEYIRKLAAYLVRSYMRTYSTVDLVINARDVFLSIDTAVPCGLIVNELISNALKHAFPDDADFSQGRAAHETNKICVELSSDAGRKVNLVIKDNGIGFPADIDFENTESLGMQLINMLTSQLDGTVTLNNKTGTEFKITFPLQKD